MIALVSGALLLQAATTGGFECRNILLRSSINAAFDALTPLLIDRADDELGVPRDSGQQP